MSQHFLLPCSCGQKVRVANSQAGGQVTCVCGKSLAVPTLRGLRELEKAPAETTGAARPAWSPVHGAVFATGLLIAAAGLFLIAYYSWRYAQVVSSPYAIDRTDEVVLFESQNIDQLSPVSMLSEWSKLVEAGLGEKGTPPWIAAKERIVECLFWIKAGACVLAAGILLSAGTFLAGRPSAALLPP